MSMLLEKYSEEGYRLSSMLSVFQKMANLSQHIPSMYFESISCHCKIKGIAIRCPSDIVVACTSSGSIIEFSNKNVLKTFEIKNCVPQSILFFISYEPFCVFYIVKSQNDVYVVAREQHLKVRHVFNGVDKVVKDDFSNVGTPQIGLWYCNREASEQPHHVTDFSSTGEPSTSNCDEFSILFNERLQETRMRCFQLKQDLEEKRNLRYKQTQALVKNQLEEGLCDQLADDFKMVTVLGEKCTSRTLTPPKFLSLRLELRKVWRKMHNELLIVGVQVVNKGKIPIEKMKLFLRFEDGNTLSYKTYFYTCEESNDVGVETKSFNSINTQWKSVELLKTNMLATAIAVFKLPTHPTDNKLVLNGAITYKIENETSQQVNQLLVPDIEIGIEEVVTGTLFVFRNIPSVSEEDLLSILVSSQCFQLLTSEPVAEILKEKFGFSSLADYGRFYNDGSRLRYLSNIFVESWHVFGNEYRLTIYSRDSSQVLSLVHCLYSALVHGAFIIPFINQKASDLEKMYKALEAEINFTTQQLMEWEEKFDVVDGKIYIPKKEYFHFKTSVFNLEKVTDELNVQNQFCSSMNCNSENS